VLIAVTGDALPIFMKYVKQCDLVGSQALSKVGAILTVDSSLDMKKSMNFNTIFDEVYSELFRIIHDEVFTKFKDTPLYSEMNNKLREKYNNARPEDFEYLGLLGKGGFGVVCEVRKKSTGRAYAMKIQSKQVVLRERGDQPWRACLEMQAFASCKHPFIVNLCFAFQTNALVVMVMELGNGWDLSMLLQALGSLPYENVKFYAAEMTSALSYLHNKGFVYRDLKPANVLLNTDGHIQLIDFGSICDLNGSISHGELVIVK